MVMMIYFTGHEKESDLAEGIYTTEYRLYDARVGRWLSVDPLFEKYVSMSPYNYCMLNPVMMVDPDGRVPIETIWDIGNILYDIGAAICNHIKGKHEVAKENWRDLGLDAAATLIPYVPAGASKVVKVGKVGEDAKGVVENADVVVKNLDEASKKSIESQRIKAVKQAWKDEKNLVEKTGRGTRLWNKSEKKELLETGKVKGYEGHHINSVKAY
ncbi:MAG: hypothetical protein IJY54_06375 [Paludibacteraceae bacterium]|nr:hypothetical protein [Paludibacteraceae bacterium]